MLPRLATCHTTSVAGQKGGQNADGWAADSPGSPAPSGYGLQAREPGLPSEELKHDLTLLAATPHLHLQGLCRMGAPQEGQRKGRDCCPPPTYHTHRTLARRSQ